MSIHEDEIPVGLPPAPGAVRRQPVNDVSPVGLEEPEGWPVPAPPEVTPSQQYECPEPPEADATGRPGRPLELLESGPSFSVVPKLESKPPWKGLPKLRYKYFWKLIGKPDHWPKMNRANQIEYEIVYLEERLRQLANATQINIGVMNSVGGSGKSTTAIYLATIIHSVTHALAYAMSSTSNMQTTGLTLYAGVDNAGADDEPARRVHEIAKLAKKDVNLRDISNMTRKSKWGVRVVAEDRPKTLERSGGFKLPQFTRVADALHSVSELILFDCGNDNVEPESIPMEVARRSDVLILTANAEKKLSLVNLSAELNIISADDSPDSPPPADGEFRSGSHIPTHEKVKRAVVVFTNTSPKQKIEDFVEFLPEGFEGVALAVPKDSYIHPKDPTQTTDIKPANPYEINKLTTYRAFLEAAVAAFEVGARLQGVRLPEPPFAAT